MKCNGCGNEKAWKTITGDDYEICDRCGSLPPVGVPDIFFDGNPEHGLADDPLTGKPRVFNSRGEKARYLKERGLSEAGDKVRGAPPSAASIEHRRDHGLSANQAVQLVKQMGADVRRREFNRIMKESGRS